MKWSIAALAAVLVCAAPKAHAVDDMWAVNTKNWTCYFGPTSPLRGPYTVYLWAKDSGIKMTQEVIGKYPDGSIRVFEQVIHNSDGTVKPLYWFADREDCEHWTARQR